MIAIRYKFSRYVCTETKTVEKTALGDSAISEHKSKKTAWLKKIPWLIGIRIHDPA